MVLNLLRDVLPEKASSQLLVLAVLLLADVAMSLPVHCSCPHESQTMRCVGCSRLPQTLPAGVLRLDMTGNHVRHIHFAANASSTLADLKFVYLNNNSISALHSGDLCPLKHLKSLDLSANNLENIEKDSIACNHELNKLVLDDNPKLKLVALRSKSLRVLSLKNCGLTSFDLELLWHLPNLQALYLLGNDACPQITEDFRRQRPHLTVRCNDKITATKNSITTTTTTTASNATASTNHYNTSATGYVPRFGIWDVPSEALPPITQDDIPHKIPLVAPIPVIPLIVILPVVLVAALFWVCKKPGHDVRADDEPGDGRLLEDLR